ncbi:hypothetical protein [Nonomuraea sp. NPDC005692]|uniref:hypothetical protein n=1 Tax=Nonomuraea sp. NPDC005692 TaxID=3157168 RepID=UPI0033DC974B
MLIAVIASPTSPAQASVTTANPCGQGYVLRSSVPVNQRWDWNKRNSRTFVAPVATIYAYAHPQKGMKCAFLSVRAGWSQRTRIKHMILQMHWPTKPGQGSQDLYGRWFDAKEIETISQSSAGPVSASVRRCVTVVASIKISSDLGYSGYSDMAAC